MTIDAINAKVLEYSENLDPITGSMNLIYTPQIKTLEIIKPIIRCQPEDRQDIVSRFVESDYYKTHKIPEELYSKITTFLLDEKYLKKKKNL